MPRSRTRRPRWIGAVLLACLLTLFVVSAFHWRTFFTSVGASIVDSQAPQPADLILVLGGDFWGPRVLKAAELATAKYSPTVLISGPPYQGRPEGQLAVEFLTSKGYPKRLFEVFGHHADSTVGEAIALRGELARRGVKRVILVTSAYHSRRAAIVLWLFCPGIDFISVPAPESNYQADQWWSNPNFRNLFFSEWRKIIGSVVLEYPKYRFSHVFGSLLDGQPAINSIRLPVVSSNSPRSVSAYL